VSKHTRRAPVQTKRLCDGCEKLCPPADIQYVWPVGRLCRRCRDQAANTPWVPDTQAKRRRQ
jgi:hypothetical protein